MLPVPVRIALVFWITLLIKSFVRNGGDCYEAQGLDSCRISGLFEVTEKMFCLKSQKWSSDSSGDSGCYTGACAFPRGYLKSTAK